MRQKLQSGRQAAGCLRSCHRRRNTNEFFDFTVRKPSRNKNLPLTLFSPGEHKVIPAGHNRSLRYTGILTPTVAVEHPETGGKFLPAIK